MTGATGWARWPTDDVRVAQQVVLGELTEAPEGVEPLPYTVLPSGRGPVGTALARALGMLVELSAEVGPHGWALTDRPGRDLARVRALAREDLDALAVAAYEYSGPLVVPVLGPVSLAARVWLARGDRGLSDPGALRELAHSLAAGTAEHLAALVRAVPGARPRLLLLEPELSAAVRGAVPNFSGRDRLRAVSAPVCAEQIAAVVRAGRAAGAEQVSVHVGADATVATVAEQAEADGIALAVQGSSAWEQVATFVEGGRRLWAQTSEPRVGEAAGQARAMADAVSTPWSRVGLPAARLRDVVLVAPPGAGTPAEARAVLRTTLAAARTLAERAAR